MHFLIFEALQILKKIKSFSRKYNDDIISEKLLKKILKNRIFLEEIIFEKSRA